MPGLPPKCRPLARLPPRQPHVGVQASPTRQGGRWLPLLLSQFCECQLRLPLPILTWIPGVMPESPPEASEASEPLSLPRPLAVTLLVLTGQGSHGRDEAHPGTPLLPKVIRKFLSTAWPGPALLPSCAPPSLWPRPPSHGPQNPWDCASLRTTVTWDTCPCVSHGCCPPLGPYSASMSLPQRGLS